jgi:hypothetical protein
VFRECLGISVLYYPLYKSFLQGGYASIISSSTVAEHATDSALRGLVFTRTDYLPWTP